MFRLNLFSLCLSTFIICFSQSQAFAFCDDLFSIFSGDSCSCNPSSLCCSADIEVGWRRDTLKWKTKEKNESYSSSNVNDCIKFDDINSYTINGQLKWVSCDYHVKASADYGWTDKGRAHESFKIQSPFLRSPVSVHTSDPIKRRSEVYDFSGAVGYPLAFFNCRLSIIPLIGFSWNRQHLRVKTSDDSSSFASYFDHKYRRGKRGPFASRKFHKFHSSSSFFVSDENKFKKFHSSNPFSSGSDPNIASALGLSNPHHTDSYRFTWYGFYLGADMAYALDSCWTLFWDTEFHFLDNCHRKRDSWTGVDAVDDYHKKGEAYGFNNIVGVNFHLCEGWYGTLSVDFNWWKSHANHDDLNWEKVGAKLGIAYAF